MIDAAGAFADAPIDSARSFRLLLEAMARPGRIMSYEILVEPPPGLSRALAGVLLTLADHDTPVWIGPSLRSGAVTGWLRFHTGAPLTEPSLAQFAVALPEEVLAVARDLAIGTAEYPDRSCTILTSVPGLDGGCAASLNGPGNASSVTFSPAGVPAGFWRLLQLNAALFPLGLDCLFIAPDKIAGVPRSCSISFDETN